MMETRKVIFFSMIFLLLLTQVAYADVMGTGIDKMDLLVWGLAGIGFIALIFVFMANLPIAIILTGIVIVGYVLLFKGGV